MLFICLIINMFYHVNCLPCLIFIWVSNTPIDNQLLTKTFCSPPGDRLFGRDAGKQKDCGLMRKPHPAHSGHQVMSPSSGKLSKLAEPLSATTIVIAGRHGQERISFRMLLPSEPLSCAMLSSSVCHENPLHVIMDVCMPTSTTAIPGPCHLSRQKHDAPHRMSLPETAVPLRWLSGWDPPVGFVRRTRGLETMSYFFTISGSGDA